MSAPRRSYTTKRINLTPKTETGVPDDMQGLADVGGRLKSLNQTILDTMSADDFVSAAKAKRERDKLLASESGRRMVGTLRAALTSLGPKSGLDPDTQYAISSLLPESLEKELQGRGQTLTRLDNRTDKAFFMKHAVPESEAGKMARLFSLDNPYNRKSVEYYEASRSYELFNKNKNDPARVTAEMDNYRSGVAVIKQAAFGEGSEADDSVRHLFAQDVYDAGTSAGWAPEDSAGMVRLGKAFAEQQPERDTENKNYSLNYARDFVTTHAAAARKVTGYKDTLDLLNNNNWLDPTMRPRDMAPKVAVVAQRLNQARGGGAGMGARMTPADEAVVAKYFAAQEGLTTLSEGDPVKMAQVMRKLEKQATAYALTFDSIFNMSDEDLDGAADAVTADKEVPPGRALADIQRDRENVANVYDTLIEQAPEIQPQVEAYGMFMGVDDVKKLDDSGRDELIVKAQHLLANDLGELQITGEAEAALRELAELPLSGAEATSFPGRDEFLKTLASKKTTRTAGGPRLVAAQADEKLRGVERQLGEVLGTLAVRSVTRNYDDVTVLALLKNEKLNFGDQTVSVYDFIRRLPDGDDYLDAIVKPHAESHQSWLPQIKRGSLVLPDIMPMLRNVDQQVIAITENVLAGRKEPFKTGVKDPHRVGNDLMGKALRGGLIDLTNTGEIRFVDTPRARPFASEEDLSEARGTFDSKFDRVKTVLTSEFSDLGTQFGDPTLVRTVKQLGALSRKRAQLGREGVELITKYPEAALEVRDTSPEAKDGAARGLGQTANVVSAVLGAAHPKAQRVQRSAEDAMALAKLSLDMRKQVMDEQKLVVDKQDSDLDRAVAVLEGRLDRMAKANSDALRAGMPLPHSKEDIDTVEAQLADRLAQ